MHWMDIYSKVKMLMITINYVYGFRFLFSADVEDENIDFYGKIVYCRVYKCAIQQEIR